MMKKFDLAKALSGEKVICRDSSKVIELKYFDNNASGHRLVGIIENRGEFDSWGNDGSYLRYVTPSNRDLFMEDKTKTYYVNIYKREDNGNFYTGVVSSNGY